MPGLAASNSSIRPRKAPAGSSGSHHCENSRVTSAARAGVETPALPTRTAATLRIAVKRVLILAFFFIFPPKALVFRAVLRRLMRNLARLKGQ